MIACAKGLASGYAPVFCVVTNDLIHDTIKKGNGSFVHGHTYSQNPLSCATALAVLEYIESHGLIARSARMGEYLLNKLQVLYRHEMVGDVRGLGLFAGVEFVRDRASKAPFDTRLKVNHLIGKRAFENGLITYPGGGGADGIHGDHSLLAPPFTITEAQIDEMVAILDQAITEVSRELQRNGSGL